MVNASWPQMKDSDPLTLALAKNIECRAFLGVFEIDHKFVTAAEIKERLNNRDMPHQDA
jgi:hypothetical protein